MVKMCVKGLIGAGSITRELSPDSSPYDVCKCAFITEQIKLVRVHV